MSITVSKNPKINKLLNEGKSYISKIEEKIKDELNNYCVECGEENPEYISVNNGIFICKDCAQNHLKLPKNISEIKKNNIKSLTLNEIQYLLCGGNRSLLYFICNEYPKLAELPSNILYRTQAMVYYRQYLQFLINGCIPPIKPNIKTAYTIPYIFENNKNKICKNFDEISNKNEVYTNTENGNIFNNNNNLNFNKAGYIFKQKEKKINVNDNPNLYDNYEKSNFYVDNTIGNKYYNYDNYFINRPRQVNFQNNNNIIIGSKMEFINNINNNKKNFLHSSEKINKTKKNINEYINKINNNLNSDIYIKPKLILSHNISKARLKNKNYYYSQISNKPIKSKIDSIQLNFSKDNINNNNYKKRKVNKNLSQEIYKKNKKYIKINKYMHKSFSQKIFNINKGNHHINDIKKENSNSNTNNKNNNYIIVNQTENNQNIPKSNYTINYTKNIIDNNICITNNEEFQIIPRKKTIDININNNELSNNNTIYINKIKKDENEIQSQKNLENQVNFNTLPIKINIKVNKKEYIENNLNNEKEIKKENNIKEIKKEKDKVSENNLISKCYKNIFLLKEKESKNPLIINKEKDKKEKYINNMNNKINNNNLKKRIHKNSSQEDISKQLNQHIQMNLNDNNKFEKIEKTEKKKFSIRNRYKVKAKHK